MKLRERAGKPERVRASEVLVELSPAVEFDIDRDVPAEFWEEVEGCIQRFIEDPIMNSDDGPVVCRLAAVVPTFRQRLRQNDEFKQAVQTAVTTYDQGRESLQHITTSELLEVFPEFKLNSLYTAGKLRAELDRLEIAMNQTGREQEFLRYAPLLQLFPEHQVEIKSSLSKVSGNIWTYLENERGEYEATGLAHILATAQLLFPEQKSKLQAWVRPYHKELLREIKGKWIGESASTIKNLTILCSEEAVIATDGSLQITPFKHSPAPKTLPERLVG